MGQGQPVVAALAAGYRLAWAVAAALVAVSVVITAAVLRQEPAVAAADADEEAAA